MEKLRITVPIVPCDQDAPREAVGDEFLRVFAERFPGVAIYELAERRPFWRQPRTQYVIYGDVDEWEAMEFAFDHHGERDGYELVKTESRRTDGTPLILTLHFRVEIEPDWPFDPVFMT